MKHAVGLVRVVSVKCQLDDLSPVSQNPGFKRLDIVIYACNAHAGM